MFELAFIAEKFYLNLVIFKLELIFLKIEFMKVIVIVLLILGGSAGLIKRIPRGSTSG